MLPDHNKRRQQKQKAHCGKSIDPACKKAVDLKHLKLFFPAFGCDQVPKAGKYGIKNNIHKICHGGKDHIIVSHISHKRNIDKGGNDHTVCLKSRHIPHLMKHQRLGLSYHLSRFLMGELLYLLIQKIRVQAVQIAAYEDLLQKLYRRCCQKIQIKVPGKKDHKDLQRDGDHFGNRDHIGLNIIFLLRIDQTVLICHKIGAYRIK